MSAQHPDPRLVLDNAALSVQDKATQLSALVQQSVAAGQWADVIAIVRAGVYYALSS